MDASLKMEVQVTNIASLVFFHLHQVRQLAPFLSCPDLATIIHAMTTARLLLDYYHARLL